MKSRRKYTKGERISSLDELYKSDFIWWRGKVYHKGWFASWQIRYCYIQINGVGIYHVEKIVEEPVEGLVKNEI